ncbi:hypothetical protein KVR01_000085 [Diaporthe batatas]|uniref:uncharacterized protein n=1 Tax=Diaporthe batatas TaxID=748121 RepID=UPI001D0530EA|nr:uncharacterized protein KVR01_000085 [Diaporthe batatas]KAG8169340.1 hypothetical protein KVR01_000085 [Diaporthe batatas]
MGMASSETKASNGGQGSVEESFGSQDRIKYRIEYLSTVTPGAASGSDEDESSTNNEEPFIMEYVEVRYTTEPFDSGPAKERNPRQYHTHTKGHSYITILSSALIEALRCVVDYYPDVNLSGHTVRIYEPFCIFVFYEKELTELRKRLEACQSDDRLLACKNRHAYEHIGVVQNFVRDRVQKDVDAERERHSRGYATFDMLWLLYKPGTDHYTDLADIGEHEPWVLESCKFRINNGTTNRYEARWWKLSANPGLIGPFTGQRFINRFAGEKEIVSMVSFPCEYMSRSKEIEIGDSEKIRQHFVKRGKAWYDIQRSKKCYQFDGITTRYPRVSINSLIMIDSESLSSDLSKEADLQPATLVETVAHPTAPYRLCRCDLCEEYIYRNITTPKFSGYSKFSPFAVEELTEHQYFLCDMEVHAFVFKLRIWEALHVTGVKEAEFDTALFEKLVLNEFTKKMIKDLTEMYIRDTAKPTTGNDTYIKLTSVHKTIGPKEDVKTWSADFVRGKGEGLTILLHGKPGVGKTYTAECIADYTKRPLLSLTCSDIGVEPTKVERNLIHWFDIAQVWGAIVLIDEADIFMEERQPQDLARNHLVAGFLRALEYFKGIVFLTTNRVGTFDEAFISRIHVSIYYGEFTPEQRIKVWDTFFEKLELDRESTMRILSSAKDYVQSSELQNLKWNGREIRNAFQVAVALAEAQGQKDDKGRILIKKEHVKATVDMSKEFSDYLKRVHRHDMSKKAALMGIRNDAYDSSQGSSSNLPRK